MDRILITGGAGFVGANLAHAFRRANPSASIVALDNLKRRGSELNLANFRRLGIEFVHGDIRNPSDLEDLRGNFDLFLECSAEPSVLAGLQNAPNYLLQTNLSGTLNCLEFARKRAKSFVFLSTSRVYSLKPLKEIRLVEAATRFEIAQDQSWPGVTTRGIAEGFPTHLPRSLYGATKLASELIIQEYVDSYGLQAVINRCGVLVGPGQFGKTDQGVFTLWIAHHLFNRPLKYTGFGGNGKQVRDLLHPEDLFSLLKKQLERIEQCSGEIYNVGGGPGVSVSLAEWTALCEQIVGRSVPIQQELLTSPVDVPLYVTDFQKAKDAFDWEPSKNPKEIVEDTYNWLKSHQETLRAWLY